MSGLDLPPRSSPKDGEGAKQGAQIPNEIEVWLLRQVKSANAIIVPNVETMGCNHQFIIAFHVHTPVVLMPLGQQANCSIMYQPVRRKMYCPSVPSLHETRKMVLRGKAMLESEALGWLAGN